MAVPPIPSGVSLQDNIALANNRRGWGDAPYGDDHSDQHWIKEGIEYARAQGY